MGELGRVIIASGIMSVLFSFLFTPKSFKQWVIGTLGMWAVLGLTLHILMNVHLITHWGRLP